MEDHGNKPAAGSRAPSCSPACQGPARLDVSMEELEAILEHAKVAALGEEELAVLKTVIQTLQFLTRELEKRSVSIQRLRQLLFGATTERTAQVIEKVLKDGGGGAAGAGMVDDAGATAGAGQKPRGHGRNGAAAYEGVKRVRVALGSLQAGDACPDCTKGTVYASGQPGVIVRLTGQAPIGGAVYELEKLRCSLCGKVFTAAAPEGVGDRKYDEESAAMIALLKYGAGVPFHRLQGLQEGLGIPLPAATQWEIVSQTTVVLMPAWRELIHQAAQGEVLHNDDTTMRVLALGNPTAAPASLLMPFAASATRPSAPAKAEPAAPATVAVGPAAESAASETVPLVPTTESAGDASTAPGAANGADAEAGGRRGVFTSGIISKAADHTIALFFTGRRHAGENLLDLLRQRSAERGPPIQMCDALSRNMPEALKTILANCLAHGRRRFVDVLGAFPQQCLHVLQILKDVYHNDAIARQQNRNAQQRLEFHQAHSGPKMEELRAWMEQQFLQRLAEPNSALGEAITYMRKHWEALTLFLRVPGAPLDNNVCERALKKAILHRKNAYFYKTANGAHVGDLYMSLIHTCQLNGVNAFHYLTQLLKHAAAVAAAPADWMPWSYPGTLKAVQSGPAG